MARPLRNKEHINQPFPMRFTKSMMESLRTAADEQRRGISDIIRSGVEKELGGDASTQLVELTLRRGAPCGEWEPVADYDPETIELTSQIAALWGVLPGDEVLETHGCSMLAAGISEHAFLHMRPLTLQMPHHGDICAVVALRGDGEPLGTVKRWEYSGRSVKLTDGQKRRLKLPSDVTELKALSKWTGNQLGASNPTNQDILPVDVSQYRRDLERIAYHAARTNDLQVFIDTLLDVVSVKSPERIEAFLREEIEEAHQKRESRILEESQNNVKNSRSNAA